MTTSGSHRPTAMPVTLTVDDATILLGLLGVLCDQRTDDEVVAVAHRSMERLRDVLASATS